MSLLDRIFPRCNTAPVDAALVRSVGIELRAIAARQEVIHEQIEAMYSRLAEQLERADPTTQNGRALQAAFIIVMRSSAATGCAQRLYEAATCLSDYRGDAPASQPVETRKELSPCSAFPI